MASTFKTFVSDDIANTRTLLHESIPITGSIVNGTTYATNNNVKTYGHGMFQSVYDYPYTSSSANHIFDLAYGIHPFEERGTNANDFLSTPTNDLEQKRKNIYNQMAQVLVGHDVNAEIQKFDRDGDLTGGATHDQVIFFNFARLLGKDEIKKGTFSLEIGTEVTYATRNDTTTTITDTGAETNYKVNSPAGEYAILNIGPKNTGGVGNLSDTDRQAGLIFYQAGVVAINALVFHNGSNGAYNAGTPGFLSGAVEMLSNGTTMNTLLTSETVTSDEILNAVRERIVNIQFSNTTELNSTIYFCRVGHNDFNYSSNPTYLENSKIRVKDKSTDSPVSYITTVGLYSADNEMLAVAKLSEPLRKDPTNDMTLRVRLDY